MLMKLSSADMDKRNFTILIVFLSLLFLFAPVYGQKNHGIRKVVIDAGHGGHDPGTLGKKTREKDITLAVTLRLGKLIQDRMPEVEVIYTRKTDVFIELYRRAQIANDNKADLFISIHCNGVNNPVPRGVESWVMGLHKSKENLEVAKKENASILMEDNYAEYDGFNPNSPEANIIFSLFQNIYLDQSLAIASLVQEFTTKPLGLPDRGVKQAGFWVLYKTSMPGLLIETGFLSNQEDEEYLATEKGKDEMAMAIFQAFSTYKLSIEAGKAVQIADNRLNNNPVPKNEPSPEPVTPKQSPPAVETKVSPNPPKEEAPEGVVFKVQVLSHPKKLPTGSPLLKGLTDVDYYEQQGAYKYVVGNYTTLEEAIARQNKIRNGSFKDAFVVAFYKDTRITIPEAKKLLQK
jgi:N-acetylmuramoyl-L-alanine amidase